MTGPGAWLFFNPEKGMWKFSLPGPAETEAFVMVSTSLNKTKTPDEIHRQSFYQSPKPRRTIGSYGFADSQLNLHNLDGLKDNAKTVSEQLEELYKESVTRSFLDAEPED